MIRSTPTPFFLLGATASGKSALAVELAERWDGEIVGADAFQIYRGLDLLTAKPEPHLLTRATHHLIGEVPLTENFDVAKYAALAEARIGEIQARERQPIVVGGTGLYVRALTHGLADLPAADPQLHAQLAARDLPDLVAELERLDPLGAAQIDRKNPRRVIRALEVCQLTGRPFSSFRQQWNTPRFPLHGAVLSLDRAELYRRIDARTQAMWRGGVVAEVEAVREISSTAEQAIGFRDIRAHLAGELTATACLAGIQQATRHYAKRQLTWFRREEAFPPLSAEAILHLLSPSEGMTQKDSE